MIPGKMIDLTIRRDGDRRSFGFNLAELPKGALENETPMTHILRCRTCWRGEGPITDAQFVMHTASLMMLAEWCAKHVDAKHG